MRRAFRHSVSLSICTAQAAPIRAKATAHSRPHLPPLPEPRDVFIYDPEVPVLGPGGAAALPGPINQAQMELGNNVLVYTGPTLSEPIHIFGSPRLKLYAVTSAGPPTHRQTGASAPQWSGRFCMHRHRALFVSISRARLHRGCHSPLANRARAHLLCLCRRRCHPSGNSQQRLSLIRSQPIHRSEAMACGFVELAALHPDGAA